MSKIQSNIKTNLFLYFRMVCPLPKLTKDYHRVEIFHLIDPNPENLDVSAYTKYVLSGIDVRAGEKLDFSLGEQIIIDYGNSSVGHILKTDPVLIAKVYKVIRSCYADRIAGIHFVNMPTFARTLISFTKAIVSEKLKQRVFLHENNESLHQFISKDCLPVEYGGEYESIYEINS